MHETIDMESPNGSTDTAKTRNSNNESPKEDPFEDTLLSVDDTTPEPRTNRIQSMVQVVNRNDIKLAEMFNPGKGNIFVPEWAVVVGLLFLAMLLIISVAAMSILANPSRPANYLENCDGRSCMRGLDLKCMNHVCNCTSDQYFAAKCHTRKTNLEHCYSSYQCKSVLNMTCLNGLCQCNDYSYWDGTRCISRKTYRQACKADQCLKDTSLYCDSISGVCLCNTTTRFWDGTTCVIKKTYNETCSSLQHCNYLMNLDCVSGLCQCGINMFYEPTLQKCVGKLSYNQSCINSIECYGTLSCLNSTCKCETYEYYDALSLACVNKTLYLSSCSVNATCRDDLGLSCQSAMCLCDSSTQFWSSALNTCINYLTYGDLTCTANFQCGSNLVCNLGTFTCNCPKTSTVGMCDCPRSANNETYWNGTQCVPASAYGQTCIANNDYTCQNLLQGQLKCSSAGVCTCGGANSGLGSNNLCKTCPDSAFFTHAVYSYPDTCFSFSNYVETSSASKVDCTSSFGSSAKHALLINTTLKSEIMSAKNASAYWVGADNTSGTWIWLDGTGTQVVPGEFCAGEPAASGCLRIRQNNMCYESATCSSTAYFICQYSI